MKGQQTGGTAGGNDHRGRDKGSRTKYKAYEARDHQNKTRSN